MVESEALLKNSPFRTEPSYHLSNTTPELLQFQLQEDHKSKLNQLFNTHDEKNEGEYTYQEDYMNSSFNNHLQLKLDEGDLLIEELPSLISTPTSEKSDSDDSMDGSVTPSKRINYLNLKVLIENCVFEISKISKKSIVSLKAIEKIKHLIEEKTELKNYYLSKSAISQEFIGNLIDEEVESSILLKIVKSNNLLNKKINELNTEISNLTLKLNNHNLSCLLLGYIEDIKISNNINNMSMNNSLNSNYKLIFDKLINYVVSVAVQRSINLPPPTDTENDSFDEKFNWIKQCMELLIHGGSNYDQTNLTIPTRENSPRTMNDSTDMNYSILNETSLFSMNGNHIQPSSAGSNGSSIGSEHKALSDYKTALNDLRFSHQYLIKEFEYSRENSLKIIQEYRKKINSLEKELNKQKDTGKQSSMNESNTPTSANDYDEKDQEIAKLKKQLNLLKVDNLGEDTEGDVRLKKTSNGILRKEFKKIVSDIQDQHEIELSQERILRQNLQNELRKSQN